LSENLPNRRSVALRGLAEGLGLPWIMVMTSMMGFGSLAADAGMSLPGALVSTAAIWGLPGQVAMVELYATGANLLAIALAVSFANARFMPMAMSLLPLMRSAGRKRGVEYLLAQLVSINSWALCQEAFPSLPVKLRAVYFTALTLTLLVAGLVGTALGFLAVAVLPRAVTLGLIFLVPCYYALLFAGTRARRNVAALLLGAAAGPALFTLAPEWSLLLTGLVAGSVAFFLTTPRVNETREARIDE
jgi:predicted branched-subunit amino acid permease